jgi:hypothetical protein
MREMESDGRKQGFENQEGLEEDFRNEYAPCVWERRVLNT